MPEMYPIAPDRVENYSREFDIILSDGDSLPEARRARNTTGNPLRVWTIVHDHVDYDDMLELVNFFKARRGKAEAFNFTDPQTSSTYSVRFDQDTLTVEKPLGRDISPRFTLRLSITQVL